MPKYYAHKNSWKYRQSAPSSGASPRAKSTTVLEMEREPSGDYVFKGEIYKPSGISSSGRVPNTGNVPMARWDTPGPENAHYQELLRAKAWSQAKALALTLASFNDYAGLALDAKDAWDALSPLFMKPQGPPQQTTKQFKPIRAENGTRRQFALQHPDTGNWYSIGYPFNTVAGLDYQYILSLWEGTPDSPGDWYPDRPMAIYKGWLGTAPGWNLGGKGSTTQPFPGKFAETGPYMSLWTDVNNVLIQNNQYVQVMAVGPIESQIFTKYQYMQDFFIGPYGSEAAARADGEKLLARSMTLNWTIPDLPPPRYPAHMIGLANFFKQGLGIQTEQLPEKQTAVEPSTRWVFPPWPPLPPLGYITPEVPHLPGPRMVEKKARVGAGLMRAAQSAFHAITEYMDLVDALFEAIPLHKRCKTKSLVGKSLCLFEHVHDIDIGDAIVNIMWNQFEDYVIGKGLFATNVRAAQARGDRYAFRTLNSINGVGNLDELGELYGEFSESYVNPRKQDLKDFLTRKFGI